MPDNLPNDYNYSTLTRYFVHRTNYVWDQTEGAPTLEDFINELPIETFKDRFIGKLQDYGFGIEDDVTARNSRSIYRFVLRRAVSSSNDIPPGALEVKYTEQKYQELCRKNGIDFATWVKHFGISQSTISHWFGDRHDTDPSMNWSLKETRLLAYRLMAALSFPYEDICKLMSKVFFAIPFAHSSPEESVFDYFCSNSEVGEAGYDAWYADSVLFLLSEGKVPPEDLASGTYSAEELSALWEQVQNMNADDGSCTARRQCLHLVSECYDYITKYDAEIVVTPELVHDYLDEKLHGPITDNLEPIEGIQFIKTWFETFLPTVKDIRHILGGGEKTAKKNIFFEHGSKHESIHFDDGKPVDPVKLRGFLIILSFCLQAELEQETIRRRGEALRRIDPIRPLAEAITPDFVNQSSFYCETNIRLTAAGLPSLYPRNPFDLYLIVSSLHENPIELLRGFIMQMGL